MPRSSAVGSNLRQAFDQQKTDKRTCADRPIGLTSSLRLAHPRTNCLTKLTQTASNSPWGDRMNIAVIGGGVFGAVIAIKLAEMGPAVSLFERLPALMQAASSNANR